MQTLHHAHPYARAFVAQVDAEVAEELAHKRRADAYRAHMESLPAKHAAEHAEWLALTDDERAWASMSPYERAAQANDEAAADRFGSEA